MVQPEEEKEAGQVMRCEKEAARAALMFSPSLLISAFLDYPLGDGVWSRSPFKIGKQGGEYKKGIVEFASMAFWWYGLGVTLLKLPWFIPSTLSHHFTDVGNGKTRGRAD